MGRCIPCTSQKFLPGCPNSVGFCQPWQCDWNDHLTQLSRKVDTQPTESCIETKTVCDQHPIYDFGQQAYCKFCSETSDKECVDQLAFISPFICEDFELTAQPRSPCKVCQKLLDDLRDNERHLEDALEHLEVCRIAMYFYCQLYDFDRLHDLSLKSYCYNPERHWNECSTAECAAKKIDLLEESCPRACPKESFDLTGDNKLDVNDVTAMLQKIHNEAVDTVDSRRELKKQNYLNKVKKFGFTPASASKPSLKSRNPFTLFQQN